MVRGSFSGRKPPLPPKPSILEVFEHYYEHIEIPEWGGPWKKILCPLHVEERPSASINSEVGYWKCHVCDVAEDAWDIVQREEGIGFREAIEWCNARFFGGSEAVSEPVPRESSRRVPHRPRFGRGGGEVPSRIRRRFGEGGS